MIRAWRYARPRPDCGCPETWLIEFADESDGAWDRRVLGAPVEGDMHRAPNGDWHLFDGQHWMLAPAPQERPDGRW